MSAAITRSLPRRIRDEIAAGIASEGLRPGDRLPTEAAIAERFGVGRTTAREALKLLEADGLVEVRHGSGRFVSAVATLERPITRLESVTELLRSHGYGVDNRVVSVEERPATPEEGAAFGVAATTRGRRTAGQSADPASVIRLERVRLHDGEPLIWSIDVFPRALLEGTLDAIDWTGSLFELLESSGRRVVGAVAQLRAVRLPPEGRRAVGERGAAPWMRFSHRNLDAAGHVLVLSEDYYRGDRFTFNVSRRRD